MTEPWLDSLSEDWKSEHHSSSPSASANRSRIDGTSSRSRIPHLRQSIGKDSVNGSYLQPRSARGIARSKMSPALAERSASSLNVPAPQQAPSLSEKHGSTLPRQVSSVFSDSQHSVQHHTLHHLSTRESRDTVPEWKKRLARGEDVAGEGVDLFGPSKLEGVFKRPTTDQENAGKERPSSRKQQTPWTNLNLPTLPTSFEQPHTFRTSRSRLPGMAVLEELTEDEASLQETSDIGECLNDNTSPNGFVKGRVESLERRQGCIANEMSPQSKKSRATSEAGKSQDPRLRTISGQEEVLNEDLSPVTVSKQNTIRDRALKDSLDIEVEDLRTRLKESDTDDMPRPSSSSSDQAVQYGHRRNNSGQKSREESNIELTTHSLPEDLSMGTQEFVSNGGYVSRKRGGYSNENSFQRKALSSSAASSYPHSRRPSYLPGDIRSSPPPYTDSKYDFGDNSRLTASVPATPSSASLVRHTDVSSRPLSSGSPLKLFGNRDTYTNKVLSRVLSQFEEADSALENDSSVAMELEQQADANFRMSQFGKGELDDFGFQKTVEREEVIMMEQHDPENRIFDTVEVSIKQSCALTNQIRRPVPDTEHSACPAEADIKSKRVPESPEKDRTPKRRRTLLRDELQISSFEETGKAEALNDITRLAGTKHKDSRSETNGEDVDPQVLASRSMLRPRSTKRRSSSSVQHVLNDISNTETWQAVDGIDTELTQALAEELATFANGVTQAATDSRKPSLATKDYMEEANKVMQFIRAKGKPKTSLPNIDEPDISEPNPDATLDLDIDADSTKDSFSRPPSREGPRIARPDQRCAQHDPRIASHLRKYKDQDDLELLASTSVLGALHLVDNHTAYEAALVPVPDEEQESSPPNMRILNSDETQRKRQHSTSTLEQPESSHRENLQQTQSSSDSSTRRTFPTGSSSGSGQRGMITSGTVSIPDQVGRMTFDHARKVWFREKKTAVKTKKPQRRKRETASEEDPFENIPDLSIDEMQEEELKTVSQPSTLNGTVKVAAVDWNRPQENEANLNNEDDLPVDTFKPSSQRSGGLNMKSDRSQEQTQGATDAQAAEAQNSLRSQVSEHELLVHNGLPSRPPKASKNTKKQPRVVTIAFSSPLVSAVNYNDEPSMSDVDLDEPDNLPLDDSELPASSPVTNRATEWAQRVKETKSLRESAASSSARHDQYRAMTLNRRPVSRIDEREEEEEVVNIEMGVVHVTNPGTLTPASLQKKTAIKAPRTGTKGTSIIALTPLSEFTLHQIDNDRHPEQSYVGKRANPKSLRQAHGSLALTVDDLIKAITDAEPTELFWDQVRRLNLAGKGLTNLHGLSEYCTTLEELNIRENQICQLNGLPGSIRSLDIHGNRVTDLTSWGHLPNLQYIDVSKNQMDSLDGFGSLRHLRELNAGYNRISDIDGILDLDGLLRAKLNGNKLSHVNFEGAELARLIYLDLSLNHLTAIRNLQVLTSLEELNVDQNDLRGLSLPDGAILPRLRVLRASGNQLEKLDLKHFPALEELYLDTNNIQDLPGLQQAQQLRLLSLRDQASSPEIVNLILSTPSECSEIYLSSNSVPNGSPKLPLKPQYNVRRLELACCGISVLPEEIGDGFPNCRDLNLNFNAVKEISGLQGMIKLERLMLVGNRIKRLRRTCLLLSRLGGSLREVDLRENPLSLGFYETRHSSVPEGEHELTAGDVGLDLRWVKRMDEVTGLKRRMVELMLAEGCESLESLNGLPFQRRTVREKGLADEVWVVLMGRGVLKAISVPALNGEGRSEVGDEVVKEKDDAGDMDGEAVVDEERSLHVD